MPEELVRWGPDNKFRAPVPPGMSLEQAARKIEEDFGQALAVLRDDLVESRGATLTELPLAWYRVRRGLPRCMSCRSEVTVEADVLRCPECARVAAKPEWWSR